MYIAPISTNNYYCQKNIIKSNPAFTSIGCFPIAYEDCNGVIRGGQVNTGLRDDLDYKLFAKIVKTAIAPPKPESFVQKIKQALKIVPEQPWKRAKIYSLAGADGTEAYAIADAIIGEIGLEKAEKYVFPIYVSDVTEWVINDYGKAGIISFFDKELDKLPNIKQFLEFVSHDPSGASTYRIKPEFRKYFEFDVADLQAKIESLEGPKEDEVPFFVIRNCLYEGFDRSERKTIFKSITSKYPEDAYVTLGGYDLGKMRGPLEGFSAMDVGLIFVGNNTYQSSASQIKSINELFNYH